MMGLAAKAGLQPGRASGLLPPMAESQTVPVLELEGVSKSFGARIALHPLSLRLPADRCAVLVGPSGCGKSTLLRLIAGLSQPDAGVVRVQGVAMGPDSALRLRRRMGYVIQEGGLFPHLTAEQNATLLARELGWDAARAAGRVAELAELLRLPAECLARHPAGLSGGQRQRMSLMRALMLDPDILLLDEPLGALDPLVRSALQLDLREVFRRRRKTVILVTHDMAEAVFLGDEILVLREGRLVQQGAPREILLNPVEDFVRDFLRAQRSLLELTGGERS
jgi:osmoprotectant transport system ATP-binding protein